MVPAGQLTDLVLRVVTGVLSHLAAWWPVTLLVAVFVVAAFIYRETRRRP